jgi:opacity protein-like surface antigen
MIAPDWPLHACQGMERARLLRWIIAAAVILAFAPSVFAADLAPPSSVFAADVAPPPSWLPAGPALFTRWSGFYAGGNVSYSSATAEFAKATQPLVASSLVETTLEALIQPSNFPVLGTASSSASGFGGFAGYNTQWQDLVLSLEADYTHSPVNVVSSSSPILDRVFTVGSDLDSVSLSGTGSLSVTDYGSLRARAGWVVDNFLPYGFAGVALGRGDYAVTSLIFGQQNSATPPPPLTFPCGAPSPTCTNFAFANSAARNGVLLYGFSVGGGFDWALTSNIFVRAEYEYIQFAPIANITASISSARVGVGFKF